MVKLAKWSNEHNQQNNMILKWLRYEREQNWTTYSRTACWKSKDPLPWIKSEFVLKHNWWIRK